MRALIFPFIFSLFLALGIPIHGQKYNGIRLGLDILPPIIGTYLGDRAGLEFTSDIGINEKYLAVMNVGYLTSDYKAMINEGSSIEKTLYRFKGSGNYITLGLDKNLLQNPKFKGNDVVTIGFRYGYSRMNSAYSIINSDSGYWENKRILPDILNSNFGNHWIELTGGIKAELFKNFFIGWNISGHFLLKSGAPSNASPYLIPGYGRGDKSKNLGYHYYICYRIPLNPFSSKSSPEKDSKILPKGPSSKKTENL